MASANSLGHTRSISIGPFSITVNVLPGISLCTVSWTNTENVTGGGNHLRGALDQRQFRPRVISLTRPMHFFTPWSGPDFFQETFLNNV